jgi:uncharacterized protein
MLIENEFEVAAPPDTVWAFLNDIPRVAPCLPGAELTEVVDDDTYKGLVTTRLGPVSLRFTGTVHVTGRDDRARTVVMDATGSEVKGRGEATMAITSRVLPAGRGAKVAVSQDLQISGAAAQYGRGMIADVTSVLMRQFAANMQNAIDRGDGQAPAGSAGSAAGSAASVSGLSIGFQAALLAFRRMLRRFFGRSVRP